jgi:hypothetical protein
MTHRAMIDGSFAHLKLGRLPARQDPRTLMLARYIDSAVVLPTVPAAVDHTTDVPSWPMYGNDTLGDCTCASAGHLIQCWSAAHGHEVVLGEAAVDRAYWETGIPPASHGVAGGPTDTGRNELDVLNYWRHHGVGRHKIAAYAAVDPANVAMVKAAIYLFGGVYTGIQLPLTAQNQPEWDVVGDGATGYSAPDSWGGHAVPYLAYDQSTFTAITWGEPMKLTTAFHTAYTNEVYAIISPDWAPASGASPDGFNQAALVADLATVSSAPKAVPPSPTPA